MSDIGFDPLDQEFLAVDAIRQETFQSLAQLELEKHRLRLHLVVNDGNTEARTSNGKSIGEEIAAIDAATEKIKSVYGHILYPAAPAEPQDGN